MKPIKVNYYVFILIALIAMSGFCVWYAIHTRQQYEQLLSEKNTKEKAFDAAAKIVNNYTDKQGQNHVVIDPEVTTFTKTRWKEEVIPSGVLDSAAMAMRIQKERINGLTRVLIMSQAENLRARRQIDSLRKIKYSYENKWIKMTFSPDRDSTDKDTGGVFSYAYTAELNQIGYYKRAIPVIGAKKKYIDFFLSDTNATLTGIKHAEMIAERTNYFKVGGAIRYVMTDQKFHQGIRAELGLGRLSFSGAGFYDFKRKSWTPVIGANLTFIDF